MSSFVYADSTVLNENVFTTPIISEGVVNGSAPIIQPNGTTSKRGLSYTSNGTKYDASKNVLII